MDNQRSRGLILLFYVTASHKDDMQKGLIPLRQTTAR